MNYVISGEGILVADDRDRELREGDFAPVLPGEEHQYKNSSEDQSPVMICAVPKEYEGQFPWYPSSKRLPSHSDRDCVIQRVRNIALAVDLHLAGDKIELRGLQA